MARAKGLKFEAGILALLLVVVGLPVTYYAATNHNSETTTTQHASGFDYTIVPGANGCYYKSTCEHACPINNPNCCGSSQLLCPPSPPTNPPPSAMPGNQVNLTDTSPAPTDAYKSGDISTPNITGCPGGQSSCYSIWANFWPSSGTVHNTTFHLNGQYGGIPNGSNGVYCWAYVPSNGQYVYLNLSHTASSLPNNFGFSYGLPPGLWNVSGFYPYCYGEMTNNTSTVRRAWGPYTTITH